MTHPMDRYNSFLISARVGPHFCERLELQGRLIRRAREERALTQHALAEAAFTTTEIVGDVENGLPEVPIGYYLAVAQQVGIGVLAVDKLYPEDVFGTPPVSDREGKKV